MPHFAKLSGPDLVKEYRSEEQSGLALLFYTDLILSDVAQGAYSEGEALRRIFEFTDSPNVSVRNR